MIDLHRFQDLHQLQPRCKLNSRIVTLGERGLQTHLIEAFPASASEPVLLPLILLLHGFPELAFSWRKVLSPLAVAHGGYHVVAPDLRGFGGTVAQDRPPKQIQYDDPIAPFHPLNIVDDILSLVRALRHDSVAMLVGHDLGSLIAGHCVTVYPDLFGSVVFMSAPFTGVERPPPPPLPDRRDRANITDTEDKPLAPLVQAVSTALTALAPPRKHYITYFSSRGANKDMLGRGQEDVHRFLGGYFHIKSGAWEGNTTHPLPSASTPSPTIDAIARDLATLPEYYVMPAHENMRQLIDRYRKASPARFTWPSEETRDGEFYASEFARTGFQGGLNYYRSALLPPPVECVKKLSELSGRERMRIPAAFVAGARDWGAYQTPGALEKMKVLFRMKDDDVVLIGGAGHWVQQEKPAQLIVALLQFLEKVARRAY